MRELTKDELWKGIIEDLFEDFLHYFYPNLVKEVDFRKAPVFLDKELKLLYPESDNKNRRVDVLVKVHLKNGKEAWLLVHIEVQGYEDKDFPLRMYVYHYRCFDRFQKDMIALAILTDENPNYRPSYYEWKKENTAIRYDFGMFKLLDYEEAYFEKEENPFAAVLQIARSHIRNKQLKTDEDLLSLKKKLFKNMLLKGHSKHIIRQITGFIKYYVKFDNKEYYSKFERHIDIVNKNQPAMGLLEMLKKIDFENGLEKGIEKGIEKGRTETLSEAEQKIIQERHKTIRNLLKREFSADEIADILEYEIKEVLLVAKMVDIENRYKDGQSIEEIMGKLEVEEQFVAEVVKKMKKREEEK